MAAFKFNATADLCANYAKLQHRAHVDTDEESKIWIQIENGTFQPFSNYHHLLMILVHRINRTWVLRGALEPSGLLVGDLSFHFHEKNNKFKVFMSITLESIRKAKNKQLSMGKTNLLDKEFDSSMLQDKKQVLRGINNAFLHDQTS